jgi:hypothetical protein
MSSASRMRNPSPPQNRTTFIGNPLAHSPNQARTVISSSQVWSWKWQFCSGV